MPPLFARPPRILVLATEDWFVVSHFLPLLRALTGLGADVAVAARVQNKGDAILAAGARLIPLDFARGRLSPGRDAATALRLRQVMFREKPDAVHAIALKPIVLAAALFPFTRIPKLALHLTGTGFAGTAKTAGAGRLYRLVSRGIAHTLRRKGTWLFVENPDDVAQLGAYAALDRERITILGGAGVDPMSYPPMPLPPFAPASVGFVGRMVWSKGVDVLVEAHKRLAAEGLPLSLRLCGAPDPANPRALAQEALEAWSRTPGISWLGRQDDIPGFWKDTAIAAVPSRGGEGLPRALLEAAACARPLIVTDVPGSRRFVRDGIEGFVVPPEDPGALAAALARLAGDRDLAVRLGAAARARLLEGFTEDHVMRDVQNAYRRFLAEHAAPAGETP